MKLRGGAWTGAEVGGGGGVSIRSRLPPQLRLRARLRLRTRLRTTADLHARRTPGIRALPTSRLGTRATLRFPGRRAIGPPVWTSFDLNL